MDSFLMLEDIVLGNYDPAWGDRIDGFLLEAIKTVCEEVFRLAIEEETDY